MNKKDIALLKAEAESMREVMQDLDSVLSMVPLIAGRTVASVRKLGAEESGQKLLKDFSILQLEENFRAIHEYAESPIEKMFLSCLGMSFAMYYPFSAVFTPPINVEEFAKTLKEDYKAVMAMRQSFRDAGGSEDIKDFIDNVEKHPDVDDDMLSIITRYIFLYDMFDLYNSFHFTLQPQLEQIRVNGKKIRPDLYIWLPSNPTFKLIVECDGFEFHSNRKAFSNDRVRDRVLQQKGFQVFRFSGHEIYHNPAGKAIELFEHLMEIKERQH